MRTATSTRDLERVEVMGQVAQEGLNLVDAAAMLQLSYRKVKRTWRRYRQVGRQGMKHAHAGRPSNPSR
jgi:transposase